MATVENNLGQEIHSYYAKWILTFFKFYHRSLLTPYLIELDKKTSSYKCTIGSRFFQIGFVVSHSIGAIYTVWGLTISTMHEQSPSAMMNGMYKFSYLLFGGFNMVWLIFMWKGVPSVALILNKGQELCCSLVQELPNNLPKSIPSRNFMQKISGYVRWPCMFAVVLFTVVSTLAFYTQGIIEKDHTIETLVDHVVNETVISFCQVHELWCTLLEPKLSAYIVTALWIVIALMSELSWQTVFFMMTVWAVYFRTMLRLGLIRIRTATTDAAVFQGVQMFSKISILLDEWNEIFGTLLLVNFVNVLVYKCVSFARLVSSEIGLLATSLMVTGIMPHFVMLYYMADAHKVGCSITGVWKRKFIASKTFDDPLPMNIFHASMILNYDVLSNSVAFNGLGFFVVSFQFVGSLLGLIATYTLVTVQLASVK